jgi:hypothetical protein
LRFDEFLLSRHRWQFFQYLPVDLCLSTPMSR